MYIVNVGKTIPYTTQDWEWFPIYKNGDDWGALDRIHLYRQPHLLEITISIDRMSIRRIYRNI